jgi:hypothetical protein
MAEFLADLVAPEHWADTIVASIPTKAKLYGSDIVSKPPATTDGKVGVFTFIPFVKELVDDWQKPVKATPLTPEAMLMDQQKAVRVTRSKEILFYKKELRDLGILVDNDQVILANLDRMLGKLQSFWGKQIDKFIYNTLKGVFGSALTSTHQIDLGAQLNRKAIQSGKGLLTDSSEELTDLFCYSTVNQHLRSQGIIEQIPNYSAEIVNAPIMYQVEGAKITISNLVDTTGTPITGYSNYLFGKGSIYFDMPYFVTEMIYDPRVGGGALSVVLTGDLCAHVPGTSYAGAADPTDATIATAGSWTKVADHNQDIKVVRILSTN